MRPLRDLRYLPWRLRRMWSLMRLYWGTSDADWSTIALLMRFQIRRTRLHIDQHQLFEGYERAVRQMLTAEVLLTRLLSEPYDDLASHRYPTFGRAWGQRVQELERQDMELLTTILRKHLRAWWD